MAAGWKMAACGACGVDDDLRFGSCFDCSPSVVARPSGEKGVLLVRDKKSGKRWSARMHGDPIKVARLVPEDKRISPTGAEAAQDDHDEEDGWFVYKRKVPIEAKEADCDGVLVTLEGKAKYFKGDMIARGQDGEKWPIKRSIFEKTYEKVGAKVGATSLLKSASATQVWKDLWTVIKAGRLGEVARGTVDDVRHGRAVSELMEPIRGFAAWARTKDGRVGMSIGAGLAIASGVGVAYMDKVQDQSLLP